MVKGGYIILTPNHNFMQSKGVPIQAMSNHIDIFIKKTSFAGLHHLYLCPKKQVARKKRYLTVVYVFE